MSIIDRYYFCKNFPSVPPFEGGYDAQPTWWREAVQIIEREVNLVHQEQAKKWQTKG